MNVFSSKSEVLTACGLICAKCAAGHDPRFMSHTREWVHDAADARGFSLTFCPATDLRNQYQELLNG